MKGFASRLLPYALSFFSNLFIMVLELVASRLVVPHVGMSLPVWTSVIGIMLGGICLGNVLGGRLADQAEPRRVIGPLYAFGAVMTLACLWMNALIGRVPGLDALPFSLQTVVVVTLDFLIPGTVLGMISPVVAKMAVEQSKRSGSAIGDVYFWGAVGSILGTFLTGFVLLYYSPTSTIVTVVAAALACLAALMLRDRLTVALGLAAAVALGLGSIGPVARLVPSRGVPLGTTTVNPIALVGHALTLLLAIVAVGRLRAARSSSAIAAETDEIPPSVRVRLGDLAVLAFVASLVFMALEMVAGRLVARHLGSSVFGWTSVIGVLLGGLSLGNFIGGKLADAIKDEKKASWMFLVASMLTLSVLVLESPPRWLVKNPVAYMRGDRPDPWITGNSLLSEAITMAGYPWGLRVLIVVAAVFFLPSVALGTVSPVVAKLAVERLRRSKRTGQAIGQVYAWGMVGSILGTFLTGFVLIDLLGTKGMILALGTTLALAATLLGSVWHAAWAGIPLGLCIIAFVPLSFLRAQGIKWGVREEAGDPTTTQGTLAYADESDYYYIKVSNSPYRDAADPNGSVLRKRTLVLDNLIHGYFLLDHPERIEYDYEFIYAQVTRRLAAAKAKAQGLSDASKVPLKTMFLGGGSYTFPRYLQSEYKGTTADVAEIDPAVTEANHVALGLARDTTIRTTWGDARQFVQKRQGTPRYDLIFGDAFNDFSVPWHLTTREFNDKLASMLGPDGVYMINIIDVYESDDVARRRAGDKGLTEKQALTRARGLGGFLGSWVNTARLTFPNLYVFGTHDAPGTGQRETFVVVASKKPLDLADLGRRPDDAKFSNDEGQTPFEKEPYGDADMKALQVRSKGIVLTDDYAPVENLLAPVAETRGDDDE